MRQVRVAEQQRQQKRRRGLRRVAGAVVVAGIVVGIIFAVSGSSPKKVAAPKVKATTTSTSTTLAGTPITTAVSHTAIAPTCPPSTAAGAPKRVIVFTKAPPNCVTAGATYDATVQTDVGTFVIRMPVNTSPLAVNNFVFLSRYHFYDDVTFHRVIPGFVVQGGDPTGTGTGGPGYSFTGNTPPATCSKTKACYPLGAVAMANSGAASSDGSQFFIVVGAQGEALPPDYTLFGQVISGMPVVQKIAADGTPQGDPPKVLHHMVKVTITQVAA
jgi:cyclophilin family peptidyl-prolyl cis-trans isomerase